VVATGAALVAPGTGTPSKKVFSHLYFVSEAQHASNNPPAASNAPAHSATGRFADEFLSDGGITGG
jgi:hypothetical protein